MRAQRRLLVVLAVLLGPPAATVSAQTQHVILLEADSSQDIHRFIPARVTARPGEILLFRVMSGAPHNVAFEGRGLPPAVRQALNAALPGRSGDLSGPLLATNGLEYRIAVPVIPPGRYLFFSVPHRAYDMEGELIVAK